MHISFFETDTFPEDTEIDPKAYIKALDSFRKGDAVTIFTPDDTHCEIALAAVERGLHVLVTKPVVKTLSEHHKLFAAAKKNNVLVMVEVHKRFDPIYADAKDKLVSMGDFSYFDSYMSQPKHQLETFRAWAGKASDISYYLNSHHIDFHEWCFGGKALPRRVTATAATGVAEAMSIKTEDVITVTAQWENLPSGNLGTASYTAAWSAPKAEVHSQQRFFMLTHGGDCQVDQAHRGFTHTTHEGGYQSCNPLFMKYTPSVGNEFAGQQGYGYRSIEAFIDAVEKINAGAAVSDFDASLPTINTTFLTTAILEAGRVSLDNQGKPVDIVYDGDVPTSLKLA